MQVTVTFAVADYATFKYQLLNWASRFNSCCFLDNHFYESPWHQQECMVAAGSEAAVIANAPGAIDQLQHFIDQHKGQWMFGHLGFGLQAETENVPNRFSSGSGFSDLHFFVPEWLVQCNSNEVSISGPSSVEVEQAFRQIKSCSINVTGEGVRKIAYRPLVSRDAYMATIRKLQDHIRRGDCYEINYCQEFLSEDATVDPVSLYRRLSSLSPNPFSCFYRQQENYLACASPERFLMRTGSHVISQPIKGTAVREKSNELVDQACREQLRKSEKDQRENVMVVDLVRNDLSKICTQGSVKVEELFGVYTYPQVHQMISTVGGELNAGVSFAEILHACFPMGSMTGAPKRSVLQLISDYEVSARGIFSGSVGYIKPDGDFDFNVVIRSMVYNRALSRLSFHVGSGITWYSNPALEYEECMWKVAAIEKVLQG